jgi:hypothetical protein
LSVWCGAEGLRAANLCHDYIKNYSVQDYKSSCFVSEHIKPVAVESLRFF